MEISFSPLGGEGLETGFGASGRTMSMPEEEEGCLRFRDLS